MIMNVLIAICISDGLVDISYHARGLNPIWGYASCVFLGTYQNNIFKGAHILQNEQQSKLSYMFGEYYQQKLYVRRRGGELLMYKYMTRRWKFRRSVISCLR